MHTHSLLTEKRWSDEKKREGGWGRKKKEVIVGEFERVLIKKESARQ